ncbi:MAG: polysaccharide deacetylase family protein [Patescibacteria group bacterium]|nr:polysaccharide deacetylase family protein [Patescibacteria group bacterium]
MKLKLSKENKLRSAKHHTRLLLIFLLACSVLLLVTVLDYQELIYPPPHENQVSPKQYINGKAEVVEHGPRDKKRIALTFDADMTPGMYLLLEKGIVKSWYNKPIKETLDRERVKATVFLGGLWTKAYPKEAYNLAHDSLIEIGNHSYSHYAFTKNCFGLSVLKDGGHTDDVGAAQREIFKATGIIPRYFRFPGGCFNQVDVEALAKRGLKVVHWDVIAGDGFNQNADSIVRKVEGNVQNGSIVVFHIHDGPYAPKTNDALIRIIPDLKKRGFEFVTISEMIGDS